MRIESAALSDVGLVRDHNEDAFICDDSLGLYVVCDGMGGAAAGEVASGLATERLRAFFAPRVPALRTGDSQDPAFRQQLTRLADDAIQDACQAVFQSALDNDKAGMGTTLTLLLLVNRLAVVGHVGDSRMLLRRNQTLYPLTTDHSFVNEMVQRGSLTREEALKHPMAHLLTRAVGPSLNVQADTNVFDAYENDVFFLCSDGVSKELDNPAIKSALDGSDGGPIQRAAPALIRAANDAGGDDNATVVLVRLTPETGDAAGPTRTLIESKAAVLKSLALFEHLSHQELAAVVSLCSIQHVQAGESLVTPGLVSERFYVMLSGQVAVRLHAADITVVARGGAFGVSEMFDGHPAVVEAVVRAPGVVLVFERAHLNDFVQRNPTLGVKLLWRFSTSLANLVYDVLRRGSLTA